MVESMSARKSFLAANACGCTTNVDRQIAARLAQALFDGADVVAAVNGMSTATSSNSHCA